MTFSKIRTGVKAFDAQWDSKLPTELGFTNLISLFKFERGTRWWETSAYFLFDKSSRNAIDGTLASGGNEFVWVYLVKDVTPRTKTPVYHGAIVTDSQRFPLWTLQANRRGESRKILQTIEIVIRSQAWEELETAITAEFEKVFDWSGLIDDVKSNPQFDEYDGNGISGLAFMCSFPVLRELAEDHIKRLMDRSEAGDDNYDVQYIDEMLEDAIEAAAEAHDLYITVEENDVYAGRLLVDFDEELPLRYVHTYEWEVIDQDYRGTDSPYQHRAYMFPVGYPVTIKKIEGVDDITVEATADYPGTVEFVIGYRDLKV